MKINFRRLSALKKDPWKEGGMGGEKIIVEGPCMHPCYQGMLQGSRDGAVGRALAFHQCGPGSIPVPGVICGLSLLLVLVLAPRSFSPGTPVFLPP